MKLHAEPVRIIYIYGIGINRVDYVQVFIAESLVLPIQHMLNSRYIPSIRKRRTAPRGSLRKGFLLLSFIVVEASQSYRHREQHLVRNFSTSFVCVVRLIFDISLVLLRFPSPPLFRPCQTPGKDEQKE